MMGPRAERVGVDGPLVRVVGALQVVSELG